MKIIEIILILLITCGGCAPAAYWYNKNNTYERAAADCRECLYNTKMEEEEAKANAEQEKTYSSTSTESKFDKEALFNQCMIDKGYKKTWDFNIDYRIKKGFIEQDNELYNIAGK